MSMFIVVTQCTQELTWHVEAENAEDAEEYYGEGLVIKDVAGNQSIISVEAVAEEANGRHK